MLQVDRRLGPSQQRITIQWTADIVATDRRAAEAVLALEDGEEVEPAKWVYRLGDRSRKNIRQLVGFPGVSDTAHIDREGFRVLLDAPDMPVLLKRFLELGLALPVSFVFTAVGLVVMWWRRRDLGHALLRAATGPEDAPRAPLATGPTTNRQPSRFIISTLLAVQNEWDWWASRIYYPIIGALMALMALFTWWHGRTMAAEWDGWTIADWLITYSGGFVRRGLSGELVLAVSHILGMPANILAWTLFVALFVAFCVTFGVLLRARRVTFWFFVLCLSPAFVVFTFYNPEAVGRKEGLLLTAAAAWAVAASRRPSGVARAAAFAVLAFALTLMHELFFFFAPHFVVASYVQARQRGSHERWWVSALIPVGSALAMLLVLSSSASIGDRALCDRLVAAGAPGRVCRGVMSYGRESVGDAVQDFERTASAQAALALGRATVLTLGPPMLFVMISSGTVQTAYRSMGALLLAVAFSGPLFVVGIDWGRWLAIHAALATVTCALLLPERGQFPSRPPYTARSIVALATGLLVLVTMFGWSVEHCCSGTLVTPFGPSEAVSNLREKLEFE